MQAVKWSQELTEAVHTFKKSNTSKDLSNLDEVLKPLAVSGDEKKAFVLHVSKLKANAQLDGVWQ